MIAGYNSAKTPTRARLDSVVAAFRASGQASISLIDMPDVPGGPLVHVIVTAGTRTETEAFASAIGAMETEQVWRDGKTWIVAELREPGLVVLIRSDDLTEAEQSAA